MYEKIINVYYGQDCLPYKDKERQVHFPIVGGSFLGASDTTKIRFYFDRIGNANVTWVAITKLPNGKQGSKVLEVSTDSEINEHYCELALSNWYTQAKGDVFIALQGYQGGVNYTYDSESGLYTISGTPTIQTTGSIKLSINYAPIGDSPDYNDEFTTFQQILAGLADKLDVVDGIVVAYDISQIVASNYEDGQMFYDIATKSLYRKVSGVISPFFSAYSKDETYNKSEIDTELDKKVDKLTTSGKYAYAHISGQQGEIQVSEDVINNAIPNRTSGGQLKVPTTPTDDAHATSKKYVDDNLSLKADKSDTYTKTETNTLLNAKADKSDTYTKSEIDTKLTSMLVYKGTQTVSQLNTLASTLGSNNTGWFYNVSDNGELSWTSGGTSYTLEVFAGDNVCWTGSGWDKLTMDLSVYDDKFIAAGFFEVQDYNASTGEITMIYSSELYDMSYSSDTGVLTITAN